ncbi:9349_t:CDS:2 [Funneliformis geosporum]|nr:9349_t:CDS:2 [Funneliformis geosporum]
MPKRKNASRKEWEPFVKILEKPDVSNCLLEYLCSLDCGTLKVREKKSVHRKWINAINEISKKHFSIPIQKLAKKSVDNFKVVIILFKGQDPLFSESVTSGKTVPSSIEPSSKEQKSRAVVSFWEEVSDRQKKRELGNTLFSMHFEGFSELVQNRNNPIRLDDSDDSHAEDDDKTQDDSNDSHAKDYDSEESTEEENYAYIIDLDNISEQTKPAFCSIDAWKTIISSSNISTSLPSSVEEQIDNYLKDISIKQIRESINSYKTDETDEEKYTHKVFDHFIFCLENRPEYFAQRPTTEGTFRARFIEPIMEPFIFIFKDLMDLNWGEISSSSSATRRNFNLSEGKRRRIGSKSDCIGSIVNADDKELLIFELSGAPTRLPTRHPEGDKVKLDRCMVDVLNNLLEEYKTCEFTLAKEFKVFGFQTKGYNCLISEVYIVDRGLYCRRTLSQFTLPSRVLDLYYLYDLLRSMFCFRDELVKSLGALQRLKVAKARKPDPIDPVSSYILRLPPS